jgi:hypothetical protein
MISPSPTQPPPELVSAEPEKKTVTSTPATPGRGNTRSARVVKAILRPPLKLIYYLIQFMRGHKMLTLGALLLLLLSVSLTNYVATGTPPFGIGSDPIDTGLRNVGAEANIKAWLYAVRDGNTTTLQQLEGNISQPPPSDQLIQQFSQTNGRVWKAVHVIGTTSQEDTTEDSFVEVELAPNATAPTSTNIIFHFITVQGSEDLFGIDVVTARKAVQTGQ